MDLESVRRRARKRARQVEEARRDPRFRAVMGRLVAARLLETNIDGIRPHRRKIRVCDAMWAGELEPRIFELLPALVVKKPGLFRSVRSLPNDLDEAVQAIRKGTKGPTFRGIPATDYERWVPRIGHRDKHPTVVKSFRLQRDEAKLLAQLRSQLGLGSDVEVLRAALRALRDRSGTGEAP